MWISFIVLSLISVLLIGLHGKLYITNDSLFHSSRLLELIKSNQIFPQYALNSFDFDGSAVMTMYPYIFLYPIVILFQLFKSIKVALLVNFIVATFVSLLINYFSSFSYCHKYLISYLFAIIYSMSGEAMAMYFYSPYSDLGVYFSYVFLPLVIFGFLNFIKRGHWVMLSIGMSAIMYSNVISVVFIAGFLFVWWLCNYNRITLDQCIALDKAIGLMMLTTAALWIPMVKLMVNNQLRVPNTKAIQTVSLWKLLHHALLNDFSISCQYLTIFSLLGLIVGLIAFKHFSRLTKQLYIFSIIIILFSSNLLPWHIFNSSSLISKWIMSIQTTIRFMVLPQLMLEFVLAAGLAKYLVTHVIHVKVIVVTMLVLLLSLCQFKIQHEIITQSDAINNFKQIERPVIRSHVMDYWPWADVNNQQRPIIYYSKAVDDDNGRQISTYHLGRGYYHFNTPAYVNKLSLPFFDYHGVTYRVHLDDHSVKFQSDQHKLLMLHHVQPGKHTVHIKIPLVKSTIVARLLTLISLIIYGYLLINRTRHRQEDL